MAVLMAVSGVALPAVLTTVFLTADRLTPIGTAVEAFAWIITAFAVGSATGSAATGPIVAGGLRWGFLVAPGAALLAVLAMAAVAYGGHRPAAGGRLREMPSRTSGTGRAGDVPSGWAGDVSSGWAGDVSAGWAGDLPSGWPGDVPPDGRSSDVPDGRPAA